jgi:hypothetical protein
MSSLKDRKSNRKRSPFTTTKYGIQTTLADASKQPPVEASMGRAKEVSARLSDLPVTGARERLRARDTAYSDLIQADALHVDVDSSRRLTSSDAPGSQRVPGDCVRVGKLVAIRDGLIPYVVFPGQSGTAAIAARTVTALSSGDIGREIVMSLIDGDQDQPVIIGRLVDDRARPLGGAVDEVEIDADGRRLLVTARDEIVLQCGKASITLTRTGKVVIRGTYVISRSSGVNCIKGGTVEIN